MAQGTATSGSAKCAVASTTPSAEFCMPTSMDTVRRSFSAKPSVFEKKYPSVNPSVCNVATAASNAGPAATIADALLPMMLAQMSATVATATSGQNGATTRTSLGAKRFASRPMITGASTTDAVLLAKPTASTGTMVPARVLVMSGVMKAARNVDAVVSTTESATLALPR